MHTAYLSNTPSRPERRLYYKTEIELQERDLQILTFILEMKFASKEELALKFFWNHEAPKERSSFLRARDRLYKLQLNKFIVPVKFQGEAKNYYMATWKAYYAVINNCETAVPCRPSRTPDYHNFHHDRYVLHSRLLLEQSKKVEGWISDRRLRQFPELSGGLSFNQVPDGILALPGNEKIAFELEIAKKENKKYAEKIKRYLTLMRSNISTSPFKSVLFVCLKENVRAALAEQTKIYGDLFKVQLWSEFISENSGLQSAN